MLFFFFFNDTATTEIYTLSLHDALPISFSSDQGRLRRTDDREQRGDDLPRAAHHHPGRRVVRVARHEDPGRHANVDRKSTRLNSSHGYISYAVFCLKKNKRRDRTETSHS